MVRMGKFMDRSCVVCGHNLGPYLRICDKCGSIQRLTEGDSAVIPPDEFGACARCGIPIPMEDLLCAECAAIESIVIESPQKNKEKKARKATAITGTVALLAVISSVIAMVMLGGSALLIILLCVAAVIVIISATLVFVVMRPPREKIESYPRYVPKEHGD